VAAVALPAMASQAMTKSERTGREVRVAVLMAGLRGKCGHPAGHARLPLAESDGRPKRSTNGEPT
jgi:hypothetical protein